MKEGRKLGYLERTPRRDSMKHPMLRLLPHKVLPHGATRGVTVSMSVFLACHQCYCAGSSLAWGLNLWAVVCGIFWSSLPWVFSGYSGFLPSFIGLMIQPTKSSANKWDFNSVKQNSWAVPSYQVARNTTCCTWSALDVFHMICTRLRLGHLSVRVGDNSRRCEEIVKNLE